MSYRTLDAIHVEDAAVSFLKVVAVTVTTAGVDRAFDALDADAMVKGHAWRAIKHAVGNVSVVTWQRKASPAAVQAMLARAIAFAEKPRHAHPGVIEQGENAEKWVIAARIAVHANKVNRYVEGRLAGKRHRDLRRFGIHFMDREAA